MQSPSSETNTHFSHDPPTTISTVDDDCPLCAINQQRFNALAFSSSSFGCFSANEELLISRFWFFSVCLRSHFQLDRVLALAIVCFVCFNGLFWFLICLQVITKWFADVAPFVLLLRVLVVVVSVLVIELWTKVCCLFLLLICRRNQIDFTSYTIRSARPAPP